MLDTFKVRGATSDDAKALIPLWLELYQLHISELGGQLLHSEVEGQLNAYLSHPECLHFLAESEGKVIGFVAGELTHLTSPLKPSSSLGSIDHWFVSEDYRSSGVGKVLLEKIENAFAGLGASSLQVEVWSFNKNALNYYQKLGYRAHIQVLEKKL